MTRIRLLAVVSGLGLAMLPAMAGAQTTPMGGDAYGGAKVGEEEVQPAPLMPEEKTHETAPAPMEEEKKIEEEEKDVDVSGGVHEAPPPAPVVMEEEKKKEKERLVPFGLALSVGGGITDFVDSDMRDLSDLGGSWDARVMFGTRHIVGVEAAYIGSAQDIQALGLDDDAVLLQNGIEGLVRANLGTFDIQPYVGAGVGWSRYNVVNEDFNTSSINDDDDIIAVPLAAGVSTYLPGGMGDFVLDARFTYRATFEEDLLQPGTGNEAEEDLDNWNINLRLGYEF